MKRLIVLLILSVLFLVGCSSDELVEEKPVIYLYPEAEQEIEVEKEMAETVDYQEYIVQSGDTLAKISREFYGTDEKIGEICSLNGIADGDYIQVGEIILLP